MAEVLTGPAFSAMNFPAEFNDSFNRAGLRTCYAPLSTDDKRYEEGFTVKRDGPLVGTSLQIEAGEKLWFTFPPELKTHSEVDGPRGTYARVSLRGPDEDPDGFFSISRVLKPRNTSSARLKQGELAQLSVLDWTEQNFNASVVSTAKIGSNSPDLIVSVADTKTQFEIKGTPSLRAPLTVFDKSASRTSCPEILDDLAYMIEPDKSFVELVDIFREQDTTVGFAGDEGVVKSGKMPKQFTNITNCDILSGIREVILDHFKEGGDNYFAIFDRSSESVSCYHTGLGKNVLDAPDFPVLSTASLKTYGGSNGVSTRVGLKVKI